MLLLFLLCSVGFFPKSFKEINKQMPKLDVKKVLDQNRVMGKKVDQKSLMNNLMSQLKQKVEKKD